MTNQPDWYPPYDGPLPYDVDYPEQSSPEAMWWKGVDAGVEAAVERMEELAGKRLTGWYKATAQFIADLIRHEIGLPAAQKIGRRE